VRGMDNLIEEIQNNCKHETWYHISTSNDEYEGRTYFTCKCLDCDHIEEDRSRDFKNVIYTKKNFRDVQIKYKELKRITNNPKLILEILNEQYIEFKKGV